MRVCVKACRKENRRHPFRFAVFGQIMEIFVLTVSPAHMATKKHFSFQILPDQKIMRPTFRMKINKVAKINKYIYSKISYIEFLENTAESSYTEKFV